MITAKQLAEMKAREKAATPGPWPIDWCSMNCKRAHEFAWETGEVEEDANDIFIAHARADVPDLIAEVERLRRLCKTEKATRCLACEGTGTDEERSRDHVRPVVCENCRGTGKVKP